MMFVNLQNCAGFLRDAAPRLFPANRVITFGEYQAILYDYGENIEILSQNDPWTVAMPDDEAIAFLLRWS